jgi:hypothetical protein
MKINLAMCQNKETSPKLVEAVTDPISAKLVVIHHVSQAIKPLRKNELKNIWKYIWKRHQNSSANCSGSISNSQTQKVVRLQGVTGAANSTGSK